MRLENNFGGFLTALTVALAPLAAALNCPCPYQRVTHMAYEDDANVADEAACCHERINVVRPAASGPCCSAAKGCSCLHTMKENSYTIAVVRVHDTFPFAVHTTALAPCEAANNGRAVPSIIDSVLVSSTPTHVALCCFLC